MIITLTLGWWLLPFLAFFAYVAFAIHMADKNDRLGIALVSAWFFALMLAARFLP